MNCAEYSERVAADVDGEVGGPSEETTEHLASCKRCRRLRAETLAGRSLLRSHGLVERAPAALRVRILTALENEAPRTRKRAVLRRPRFALTALATGAAVAAAILVFLRLPAGLARSALLESYALALDRRLQVGYRTQVASELESYFAAAGGGEVPVHVVDYRAAGFELEGGLLQEVGGRRLRLVVYRAGRHVVVCDYRFARDYPAALPAVDRLLFFAKDGLSFCVRRMGDEVCILVSRMPLALFRARLSA